MTLRIAVSNQKGGAGKTTTSINVAGALAELGHEVLLIDLDPQGHSTEGLGLTEAYNASPPSLAEVLLNGDDRAAIVDLVHHHQEFDVVPSHEHMFGIEDALTTERNREERLDAALDRVADEYEHDFVLVDCPPNLGALVDNALVGCRNVLIPAPARTTAIRALEIMLEDISELEDAFGFSITTLGLVANEVTHDSEAEEMMDWFAETFPDEVPIYEIRKRVALQRAWNNGVSIFAHEEDCDMEAEYTAIAKHLQEVADGA